MSKPITKKNREHLDSLVIGSGHTIMAGYIPTSIEPQTFSENFYKWFLIRTGNPEPVN